MFSASGKSAVSSGGYTIGNSLRFRGAASASLSRTPVTTSNQTTFTWSGWHKLGNFLNSNPRFLVGRTGTNFPAFGLAIGGTTGTIYTDQYTTGGTLQFALTTTAVFRDPSAWYHLVVAYDTTQAVASNRVKIYVNGVQITSFSTATYPTQNLALNLNTTNTQYISADPANGSYWDGYLAEVNFIDGQALTPSSFGMFDTTTGVWEPIKYSGTYGTNGFYLNFSNGTSTTTLGYDSSGNNNNWTTSNISLTAGITYDWMIDSPTQSQGSSYGVGNYAVMNPLSKTNTTNPNTLSNGNLTVTIIGTGAGATDQTNSSMPLSGYVYFEATVSSTFSTAGTYAALVGVSDSTTGYSNATVAVGAYVGSGTTNGLVNYVSGTPTTFSAFTPALGDVYGFAVDVTTGKIWVRKNSATWISGDPATGTSPSRTFTNFTNLYVFVSGRENSNQFTLNFGQRPFTYAPPSGFKTLCTYNLPSPTILNGAGYMAATLYTGNGTSQSISNAVNGVSFRPDFVWIKERSVASSHAIYDSVRGNTKVLSSDAAAADYTQSPTAGLNSFNAGGFSVTYPNTGDYYINRNGQSYVSWQWKAGDTAVTNTAGSITSSVSANMTSGFSVVTWTGDGSTAKTIGHGLGSLPVFVISKNRSQAFGWDVASYYSGQGLNYAYHLYLNTTDALSGSAPYAFATQTSLSSATLNLYVHNLYNGNNYVAYCFVPVPGYSAFGSYTGNGSADGPFVYCGFRPRFLLIKRTDTAGYNWFIFDTSRSTYNVITAELYPNSSVAEANSSNDFDIVSNGFKCRFSGASFNTSGGTYIYAAFAENPFKYSLAR